jgi:hypothetical protein
MLKLVDTAMLGFWNRGNNSMCQILQSQGACPQYVTYIEATHSLHFHGAANVQQDDVWNYVKLS